MTDDSSSEDPPDYPWLIEVDLLKKAGHEFESRVEDLVILKYLMAGDTRVLAWFLLDGYTPSPGMLKFIGQMLEPGSQPTDKVPFELVAKSRTPERGRPPKGPEQELRDLLIYSRVTELIERDGPGSYEAAIDEVASLDGLERSTVRRAYDSIKRLNDQAQALK